mgnify:FL=1
MAINKQPVARKCRALGVSPAEMGYGKKQSKRNPGGTRRKKVSEYGAQLKEKQKVKFVYGVLEKQFHKYYLKATNMKGITGDNMLQLLELRLDNVVYRLGLGKTRPSDRCAWSHPRQRPEGGHSVLLREGWRRDHPASEEHRVRALQAAARRHQRRHSQVADL